MQTASNSRARNADAISYLPERQALSAQVDDYAGVINPTGWRRIAFQRQASLARIFSNGRRRTTKLPSRCRRSTFCQHGNDNGVGIRHRRTAGPSWRSRTHENFVRALVRKAMLCGQFSNRRTVKIRLGNLAVSGCFGHGRRSGLNARTKVGGSRLVYVRALAWRSARRYLEPPVERGSWTLDATDRTWRDAE